VREIGESGAEQADLAFLVAVFVKKRAKNALNVLVEVQRLRAGARARVGVKTGVANGQRERTRGEAGFAKALARFLRKMAEHGKERGEIVRVFAEGVIVRNGFWFGVDDEFVRIAAARFAVKRRSPPAENLFKFFRGMFGELRDGFDAERAKGAFGDFADAGNFAHRKRRQKLCFLAGSNPDEAARFSLIAGDFCGEAGGGEAAGAGKAGFARNGAKQFVRGGERRAVHALGAGEIEVGFVDGNHFDDGRKSREDGGDAVAPFGVFCVMAVEENGVRAKLSGGAERHGGMNAELSRFVAGGGYDAALIGTTSDDNGFTAEIGAVKMFDGDEEGVHVDVKNVGDGWGGEVVSVCRQSSKSREVRHVGRLRRECHVYNLGSFGGDDAGNSGEVVGDADVGPHGRIEKWLNGGERIVAEFEDEEAAGFEMRGGLRDETGVKFVAFFAAEKGERRFVVADFAREGWGFAAADVRRIGDDEIEKRWLVICDGRLGIHRGRHRAWSGHDIACRYGCQLIEEIRRNKVDGVRDGVFFRVAFGDGERGGRDIQGDELGLRQFLGEGDGDAAGAGAHVGNGEAGAVVFIGAAGAEFAEGETIEGDFDEMLGFRTRDQDVRSDFEGETPEFLFAGEMLDGDAGDAAVEKSLIGICLVGGEFGFGMRIEKGAFALRGVKEKQFGGERIGRDARGAKLGDAVFESGAKVHGGYVARESGFLILFGMKMARARISRRVPD